jgi:CDP-glycerol glycerophosphotransferase
VATGSDLVAGAVERFSSQRTWTPLWADDVHAVRRERIVIDQAVPLLRNLYTWDKLFRSDFWHAQGLWFREGVAYEDQPLVTQLLARAAAIDVLPDVVYRYRMRDDRSSISQQTASLRDLRDRIEAWRTSREAFRTELSPPAYQGWLQTLFEAHFQWYLASPGTDDDTYWSELHEAVVELAAEADDRVWETTSPPQRVMVRLAQLGRRADIGELVRLEGNRLDRWPARVRSDGILVELPFLGDPDLDESLFLLHPAQVRAVHGVEHLAWGPGPEPRLHVSGWAHLRKVDLRAHRQQVVVELRDTASTEVVTVAAGGGSPGRFAVEVPLDALVARRQAGTGGARWEVWLRVEAAGLVAEAPVTRTARGAVVDVPGALPVGDRDRVTAGWGHHLPLTLRVERGGD